MRVCVTGSGGFIGSHLVRALKANGHWVRGADLHLPEYGESPADEFRVVDLRDYNNCFEVTKEVDYVYNLAADMGGIGYITAHLADIAHNNTLINVNMLEAARANKVERYLFSSSACVYAQSKQQDADVIPLKEEDAYPADPEPGYGWEKLYAEQLCKYYQHDYGMNIKIARFHNVYGERGTYDGGKEKSPAALCRKVAKSEDGTIEIWGDGKQTRSYMHVADCCDGLMRLMGSECKEPINLGRDEWVTVDGLVDKIAAIADKKIKKQHDLTKPQGVRGRNSDNTLLKKVLGWEPEINLERGLRYLYPWIEAQIRHQKFYSQFMKPAELVFDIGANIGNKSKVFLNLGCGVIAVEPQSYCVEYLTTRFAQEFGGRIAIIAKAVANNNDSVIMALGTHRGVSTACPGWLQAVKGTKRFVGVDWVGTQHVQTTTLDQLIEIYGVPVFIKIDVEGFESKVIQGLSQPIKGMSFEFHPEYLADTKKGIEHLTTLGDVEFNYSLEESMTMLPEWLSAENVISALDEFVGNNTIYGDVYARFV